MSMEQLSLFDDRGRETYRPLASRMRPEDLDAFVGQEHLIGKGKILYFHYHFLIHLAFPSASIGSANTPA